MKKFLRRILSCTFGIHWTITCHDNRGVPGSWTCDDCGYHHPAIKWQKPPRPHVQGVIADAHGKLMDLSSEEYEYWTTHALPRGWTILAKPAEGEAAP